MQNPVAGAGSTSTPGAVPRGELGLMLRLLLIILALFLCGSAPHGASEPPLDVPQSTLFSTVRIEEYSTVRTESDGDLWVSCWGADGALYSANGDGWGFTRLDRRPDIVVNRITGRPPHLQGQALAMEDAVGTVWTPGGAYNRKPTGMVAVDGALYLAIQDLNRDFNDAPAASISRSTDGGKTWQWDRSGPMFRDYQFTTIFFLDYGKDSRHAPDEYVYAYGLDGNWRDSFNDRVPDPTALYLARVHKEHVQDRSQWRFFAGLDSGGRPRWVAELAGRKPVLETTRRVYPRIYTPEAPHNLTVLSQGSVVYNKPLNRYLYSSWTDYTFEFFEAPTPWGPWRLFLSKDFSGYPWVATKHGGYGVSIPSKFISRDGRTMYVQSNSFAGRVDVYRFAFRKLHVTPYRPSRATNRRSRARNLAREEGAVPIAKSIHYGQTGYFNDGVREQSEDDWDQEIKPLSWWGYTWDRRYRMNQVVYTTGGIFSDGGWFSQPPKVQVRRDFRWVDVEGLSVTPTHPGDQTSGPHRTYTFRFQDTVGDGVRIIGAPGGSRSFTSLAELEVYYADAPEAGPEPARANQTVVPTR